MANRERNGSKRWRLRAAWMSALAVAIGCGNKEPPAASTATLPGIATAAPAQAPAAAKAPSPTTAAAKAPVDKAPTPHVRYDAPIPGTPADWSAIRASTVAAPAGPPTDGSADAKQRRRSARRAAFRPLKTPALTQGFRLTYSEPGDAVQRSFQRAFQQERVLEAAVEQLNQRLKIRGIIDLEMAMCGEPNAFYDSASGGTGAQGEVERAAGAGDGRGAGKAAVDEGEGDEDDDNPAAPSSDEGSAAGPRIVICYELISEFVELFASTTEDPHELGAQVVGAVYFTLFHELGHALRDNLDLPLVGREEDAVDQLATLLLLQMGDRGVEAAIAGANAFAIEQHDNGDATLDDLWDEHSLSGQRMFDVLCLVYGSDPEGLRELVGPESVPEERAESCPADYQAILSAWSRLLQPHLIGGGPLSVQIPDIDKVSAAAQAPPTAVGPGAGRAAAAGDKAVKRGGSADERAHGDEADDEAHDEEAP